MHPSSPGGEAGEGFGGDESLPGDMSVLSTLSRYAFGRSCFGASHDPASAACNILGLEECIKATHFRNDVATEYPALLLVSARSAPRSSLEFILFLAGREPLTRHAWRPSAG